jgi:phosphohistidine phosphatase SixA
VPLTPCGSAQTATDPDAAQMPPPPPRTSEAVHKLAPAQIVAELRRGGYVLYFRHASTDFSQNDTRSKNYDDCAHQRNLTDAGRSQARAIGAAIRDLKLPIAKAIASPLCRTMETARLAFGEAEPVAAVRGAALPAADPGRYAALKELFATPYPRGANLVIASHGNPFYGVAGPPYLAEGEAAVIRGLGDHGFEIVARIRVDDWAALTAAR